MSILKSHATQLTFNPEQITKLIAADLEKKEDEIKVNYVVKNNGDDRFGVNSYELIKIEVTIKS